MDEEHKKRLDEDRLYRLAYTKRQIYISAFSHASMSLEIDIETLRIYWKQTEDFIRGNLREREKQREELKNEPTAGQFWELDKALADYSVKEGENYAQLIRGAFFIALFSFFESKFIDYAHLLSGDASLTFDGIDKIKGYLVAVQKVDFPFDRSRTWQELQGIRELRNCVVHNKGYVSKLNQTRRRRLESYIKRHSSVSIRGDKLHIEERYINDVLSIIDDFCWSFLVSVSDRFVKKTF